MRIQQPYLFQSILYDVPRREYEYYFFSVFNKIVLTTIPTRKRRTDAANGPPIPASYAFPVQNRPTEITITKTQMKEIIKFSLSTSLHLIKLYRSE
jgi:hypothetical protein